MKFIVKALASAAIATGLLASPAIAQEKKVRAKMGWA